MTPLRNCSVLFHYASLLVSEKVSFLPFYFQVRAFSIPVDSTICYFGPWVNGSPSHKLLQNIEKNCPKILKKLPKVAQILQNVAQKLLVK